MMMMIKTYNYANARLFLPTTLGSIPPEIGNCSALTELKLYWNKLSGKHLRQWVVKCIASQWHACVDIDEDHTDDDDFIFIVVLSYLHPCFHHDDDCYVDCYCDDDYGSDDDHDDNGNDNGK